MMLRSLTWNSNLPHQALLARVRHKPEPKNGNGIMSSHREWRLPYESDDQRSLRPDVTPRELQLFRRNCESSRVTTEPNICQLTHGCGKHLTVEVGECVRK